MRTLSLAALTVLELSPVAMVRCAADAGFSHVGLRLLPATPDEPVWSVVGGVGRDLGGGVGSGVVNDKPMLRELLAALADTGVQTLDIEILRLKPDTVVGDFDAVLETGARLGARYVLVAGNDPNEARLTERLAQLCERAAPLQLSVYLEPMPWTDARDFTQAARIVRRCAQANAGVLIDPIHFDRAGNVASQISSVAPEQLAYLQFCDAPAARPTQLEALLHQARAERLLPGQGGLDLRAILRAVPPNAPLSLEIPMRTSPLPAVERARLALAATRRFLAAEA
jgi:sugar phosphate isomerase/epimerase